MAEYRDQESIDKCALETQRWNTFSERLNTMLDKSNTDYHAYKTMLNEAVPAHETTANTQREKTSGQQGSMSALSMLLNENTIGTAMSLAEALLGDKKESLIEKLQDKASDLPMGDKVSGLLQGLKGKKASGAEGDLEEKLTDATEGKGGKSGGLLGSLEEKLEGKLHESGLEEKAAHLLEEKGGALLSKASEKLKGLPMGEKMSGLLSSKGGGLLKKASEKLSSGSLSKSGAGLLKKAGGGLLKKFKLPF